MNMVLYKLFQDNPGLAGEVAKFCRTVPGYQTAEADFASQADQISRLVGPECYFPFEAAMNAQLAYEARAYYLFGLGLRRELLSALEPDDQSPICASTPTPTATARKKASTI